VIAPRDLEGVRALRACSRALEDAAGAPGGLDAGLAAAAHALVPSLAAGCSIHRDGGLPDVVAGELAAPLLDVPLVARGQPLGVLRLARAGWDERDRLLADEAAQRIATAIDADRLAAAADTAGLYDQFLATLSHELRSPLNVVGGWVDLLRADRLPPERRAQALDVIARNTQVQIRLIEDLLDASRIVAGKMRVELADVALDRLVAESLESLRPQAEASRVAVTARLTPVQVRGDAVRLAQVVHNLVGNALRYTAAGGHIRVALATADGVATLTVADDGAGIAPEFLPHVFERFRQGERRRAGGTKGLGLGLFIVRHIAQLHGGTVTAASDGPGRGATFTLGLPASR